MEVNLPSWIVRILALNGSTVGTGFVTAPDGLIVTCAHVVNQALGRPLERSERPRESVRIHFLKAGCVGHAVVIAWSPLRERDVAVLRLDAPLPEGVAHLFLGSSADALGHTFKTFGFPNASSLEEISGRCEIIGSTTRHGFPILQIRSAEVTEGFSGAPVWDESLQVAIGMAAWIAMPDRSGRLVETAFVVPVESIREVCPDLYLPEGEPYRGLQVFEVEHADLYFGREVATRELLQALSRHDVVLLVGVSGSGKSSLVRAGLEKGLREAPLPGLVERTRCLVAPGRHPMFNLVLALADFPVVGPEQAA